MPGKSSCNDAFGINDHGFPDVRNAVSIGSTRFDPYNIALIFNGPGFEEDISIHHCGRLAQLAK